MSDLIRKHYEQLLQTHGDSHVSAQYSSRESQEARYRILTDIPGLQGASVLDFGCGTGHLASYLKQAGIDCQYTGVDIVEDFFPFAQEKHPAHRFGVWDDFSTEEFDFAFVSGVFNNRMDDNEEFFRSTIKLLFGKVRKGLAFNLMSRYVDYEDPGLWYASPENVFAFMKTLTPYVTIRNDYVVKETAVPFEFAVYAFRDPVRAWK